MECYICCESDGELFTGLCKCNNTIHIDCLKKMILEVEGYKNGTCLICKENYKGIEIKQTKRINKLWVILWSLNVSCILLLFAIITDTVEQLGKLECGILEHNITLPLSLCFTYNYSITNIVFCFITLLFLAHAFAITNKRLKHTNRFIETKKIVFEEELSV
jgi:hypothetical protein